MAFKKIKPLPKTTVESWNIKVRALMESLGAEPIDPPVGDSFEEWTLETQVGQLRITLFTIEQFALELYSRFAEPRRAAQVVGCNPSSGKWNWHPSRNDVDEDAQSLWIEQIQYQIQRLLPDG